MARVQCSWVMKSDTANINISLISVYRQSIFPTMRFVADATHSTCRILRCRSQPSPLRTHLPTLLAERRLVSAPGRTGPGRYVLRACTHKPRRGGLAVTPVGN